MNKKILLEVSNAFADCTQEWEQAVKIRNLNYKATESVDPLTAFQIMNKAIGDYNEFEAKLLKLFPKHARIVIARENSVCIYVSGVKETDLPSMSALKADEYGWNNGILRVWWD